MLHTSVIWGLMLLRRVFAAVYAQMQALSTAVMEKPAGCSWCVQGCRHHPSPATGACQRNPHTNKPAALIEPPWSVVTNLTRLNTNTRRILGAGMPGESVLRFF